MRFTLLTTLALVLPALAVPRPTDALQAATAKSGPPTSSKTKTCSPSLKNRIFSVTLSPYGLNEWHKYSFEGCSSGDCAAFGFEPQASTPLLGSEFSVWTTDSNGAHQITEAYYPFNDPVNTVKPGVDCLWVPAAGGDVYQRGCQSVPSNSRKFFITCKSCYPPPGVYALGIDCSFKSDAWKQCISSSLGNGKLLHLAPCDGSAAQTFDIIKQDEGTI